MPKHLRILKAYSDAEAYIDANTYINAENDFSEISTKFASDKFSDEFRDIFEDYLAPVFELPLYSDDIHVFTDS
jgi:hypothetical protein